MYHIIHTKKGDTSSCHFFITVFCCRGNFGCFWTCRCFLNFNCKIKFTGFKNRQLKYCHSFYCSYIESPKYIWKDFLYCLYCVQAEIAYTTCKTSYLVFEYTLLWQCKMMKNHTVHLVCFFFHCASIASAVFSSSFLIL